MSVKVIFASLIALLPSFGFAQKAQEVKVCYQEYREELMTAALNLGDEKKIFQENGISLKWIKNAKVTPANAKKILIQSNLNSDQKPQYRNTMISEISMLNNSSKDDCDVYSTTFEAVAASNVDLNQFVPAAVYLYGKDYDTHIVVRKNAGIKTVADLKGRVVRVNQIGSLIPFEMLLAQSGLTAGDVIYEKVALGDVNKALDTNHVDAVLSYNPTVPLLISSGRVSVLAENIFAKFYKNPVPHSILLLRKTDFFNNKTAVAKFMEGFEKASAELSKKPENLIYLFPNVSKNYSNAEIEKASSLLKVGAPVINKMGQENTFVSQAHFSEYADILKNNDFLKKELDLKAWR